MFKIKNYMAPKIMDWIFQRKRSSFSIRQVHLAYNIIALNHYNSWSKKWELFSDDIKESKSPEILKYKITNWFPLRCPCRLYRICLQNMCLI